MPTTNECPHRGGPLGDGSLDGEKIKCPWHDWKFSVRTGENDRVAAIKLARYKTVQMDDQIWVEI